MGLSETQSAVLDWYAANGRDLAFRRTSDPWAILVSEVLAQQTQAARAAQAWSGFLAQFPTPDALASASTASVIRAWRGLGHNRRALALRGAAIAIVEEHGGHVPGTLDALLALPGIGPYTARAVLAIAFAQPVAALDVNVRRVLGRARLGPMTPGPSQRELQTAADRLVPPGAAAAWTHALMDIGAAFCRPRNPRCEPCPLQPSCTFAANATLVLVAPVAPASFPATPARSRPAPIAFPLTVRWLRGRILDRLRDAPNGAWVAFDGPMGAHDDAAVQTSLERLAAEGLIELAGRSARLEGA